MMRRLLAQTSAPASRSRAAAAALSGLAVATLASGCMVFNPIQTDTPYEPADGLSADIGELAIRDLLLVGGESGTVVLSGAAINLGTEPVTLQVVPQTDGSGAGSEIEVGPREQLDLSTEGLRFDGLEAKPGSLVPLAVTARPGGTTVISVPLLAATGPYATVTPAPVPETSTPTEAPTATETATETATTSS